MKRVPKYIVKKVEELESKTSPNPVAVVLDDGTKEDYEIERDGKTIKIPRENNEELLKELKIKHLVIFETVSAAKNKKVT